MDKWMCECGKEMETDLVGSPNDSQARVFWHKDGSPDHMVKEPPKLISVSNETRPEPKGEVGEIKDVLRNELNIIGGEYLADSIPEEKLAIIASYLSKLKSEVVWPEKKSTNTTNKYINEDNKIFNQAIDLCREVIEGSK